MKKTKVQLKDRFVTGVKPTQEDFLNIFDSFMHKDELDETLERMNQIVLDPGQAWKVDGDLDEGSVQPVQNKVVAARLRQLAQSISTTNASLASTMGTLSNAIETIGTKADANALTQLQATYATFVREIAEYRQDMAEELNNIDSELGEKANTDDVNNALGGKLDKQQGAANAGKVMKVNARGELEPADEGGKVKTVSVNGGDPVEPDSDGNIDLLIEEGGGSLEGLSVNGIPVQPDGNGNVDITAVTAITLNGDVNGVSREGGTVNINIDLPDTVQMQHDIENAASSASQAQDAAIASMTIRTSGEDRFLRLNRQGEELEPIEVQLPAMGGGGSGTVVNTALSISIHNQTTPGNTTTFKQGDKILVGYGFSLLNASGEDYGGTANLTLLVQQGSQELLRRDISNVASGTTVEAIGANAIDITDYLAVGTISIYLRSVATYTGNDGSPATATSQAFKRLEVVELKLATTFSPAASLTQEGYGSEQTIAVPFAVSGAGSKDVYLYIDGVQRQQTSITQSGTVNKQFSIDADTLASGRHNLQMVAVGSGGLVSNVYSVDFRKAGNSDSYLGLRQSIDITTMEDMPQSFAYGDAAMSLTVEQFGEVKMDYAAWNVDTPTCRVRVQVDGETMQTLVAQRSVQTLTQRFDDSGTHTLTIAIEEDEAVVCVRTFVVTVLSLGNIETEAEGRLMNRLTSLGRSNSEESVARVNWGGVTTIRGVNWRTDGWHADEKGVTWLLLTNGGEAGIDITPFVLDAADDDYSIERSGMTLEMELEISQVVERGATVVSCLYDNGGEGYPMGIRVTTEKAALLFGGMDRIKTADKMTDAAGNYLDANGQIVSSEDAAEWLYVERPNGVERNIALNRPIKLTFVIQPKQGNFGLGLLYINGKLSGAARYSGSLVQGVPQQITISGDKADVKVRSLRYYRRPLTADEQLGNFIVDRPTGAEILSQHTANDVGDGQGTADSDGNIAINAEALKRKKHGVLTIICSEDGGMGLSDLFACTNKKADFKADLVKWEPPLDDNGNPIGKGFIARNVRIRIQGTSSVKYPYKNIRIYLLTAQDGTLVLIIGGEDVTATAKGYALRGEENSIEQEVLCAKTDFVDSSMAGNTGGAHLFDDTMRRLGLLTPPQEYDPRVRQSIDGLPCDLFAGTNENGTLTYCGQFVLNNEKSKSAKIFGMEPADGVLVPTGETTVDENGDEQPVMGDHWACPIALETLTNGSPMTLFQAAGSADSPELDAQLAAEFDKGMEFNYPEDAKWANIDEGQWDASKGKWKVKPIPGARAAIKRFYGWIHDCVADTVGIREGAMTFSNLDYGTPAGWSGKWKWVSPKFKTEVSQFFDVNHLLTYYLIINYLASKDQLVKNILWRFWDALKWYAGYYDGDTWEAIRNDAFIVYLYNIMRDSYDSERSKYAFEGHDSWLWCLVLANLDSEMKECAERLRAQLTTEKMLKEFTETMIGNWSARQYNKSGKLKYVDTIDTMNYVYTLTGSREEHITQFLTDRARLLDAQYGVGDYLDDNLTLTVQGGDNTSTVHLVSGDLYAFGWRISSGWRQGPISVPMGGELTLTINEGGTNDPQMIVGASCIKELDFTGLGAKLNGSVNLSNCAMLERLDMRRLDGQQPMNAPLTLGGTSKLRYVDITGQTSVNTGTAKIFDVSKHKRLTTFLAGETGLETVILPEGAPLETLTLPGTLTTLTLRYLGQLRNSGLTIEGYGQIRSLNIASCPGLDWTELARACMAHGHLDYLRVEGLDMEDDGSVLSQFTRLGGLDADGNATTRCQLVGDVRLTRYLDDATLAELRAAYPSLTIHLPEYTMIARDESVPDDATVTNLDNHTGFDYGTQYVPSGHISRILAQRHRVLAKLTRMPTSYYDAQNIKQNNPDGEMIYIPLHDSNSGYYADAERVEDCTTAPTDGTQGDVFIRETHYWYKGVNGWSNGQRTGILFNCYSSLERMPSRPDVTVLEYSDMEVTNNRKLATGNATFASALKNDTAYAVCKVAVSGYSRVRFPGVVPGNTLLGAMFVDADENRISDVVVNMTITKNINGVELTLEGGFRDGMYVIADVPEGATHLYFTILKSAEFDKVVLSNSDKIEDMEPDWVEVNPHLIAVTEIVADSDVPSKPRSIFVPRTSVGSISQSNVHQYAQQRGMQLVDYEMHKDVGNLFFAKYGRRDSQAQCGYGTSTYGRPMSNTRALGMQDTQVVMGVSGNTGYKNSNDQWVGCDSPNVMGYQDWQGNKAEWMDKIGVNMGQIDGKAVITMPDKTQRRVPWPTSGHYIKMVLHGKYCDTISADAAGGTETTFYCDWTNITASVGRVVYRSSSSAYANGGVSCADASYDSSSSSASIGSRLAFRGKLVRAASVEAFEAITPLA